MSGSVPAGSMALLSHRKASWQQALPLVRARGGGHATPMEYQFRVGLHSEQPLTALAGALLLVIRCYAQAASNPEQAPPSTVGECGLSLPLVYTSLTSKPGSHQKVLI